MKYQTVPLDETTSTPSSRVHRHRDGSVIGLAIFVLVASLAVWNIAEPRKEAGRNNIRANDNLPRVRPTSPPKFLFGFSTGHAGSTSIHNEMKGFFHNNCAERDISVVAHFENVAPGELGMKYDPETPSCNKTKDIVLPYLYEKFIFEKMGNRSESGWIYIDIGHFHNRLSHLECFADLLKSDVGFVHIRRDRYQIANSFARDFQTPCSRADDVQNPDIGKATHPLLSYCPHSMEKNGPVALPSPSDQIWMSLNPFQKFLWLADDLEMRWHRLTQTYKGVKEAPQFYEVTWSNPEELKASLFHVFEQMPCSGDKFTLNKSSP